MDFWTEYTLYTLDFEYFVCVFGDSDIYRPEDGYFDFECDTLEEAVEWFMCYDGFAEDFDD